LLAFSLYDSWVVPVSVPVTFPVLAAETRATLCQVTLQLNPELVVEVAMSVHWALPRFSVALLSNEPEPVNWMVQVLAVAPAVFARPVMTIAIVITATNHLRIGGNPL
jgi:hypothetical protein